MFTTRGITLRVINASSGIVMQLAANKLLAKHYPNLVMFDYSTIEPKEVLKDTLKIIVVGTAVTIVCGLASMAVTHMADNVIFPNQTGPY